MSSENIPRISATFGNSVILRFPDSIPVLSDETLRLLSLEAQDSNVPIQFADAFLRYKPVNRQADGKTTESIIAIAKKLLGKDYDYPTALKALTYLSQCLFLKHER